nr:putative ribonuclease H-like domain-containing protein [Tanacetum cinerariifolium]
ISCYSKDFTSSSCEENLLVTQKPTKIRKSTIGGFQFLDMRLISWPCKKQTTVATSTTEAEYVAATHCCGQEVNEEVTLPKKEVEVEAHKREGKSLKKEISKKQKMNEEAEALRSYLQRYPLTHFTLKQMLNNVRFEVKEESEMSLELLRLVRRQLNEGYVPA